MADILILIAQAITIDKYGREVATETNKQVYCEVHSISQTEFYAG